MIDVTAPGPTVTIYARHGELVSRIADEIRERGASTHTISIETGWVSSVSRALMVLDSPAGMSAVRGLCEADPHVSRIVALLTADADVDAQDLCDRCVERHDMVILHADTDDVVDRVVDEIVGADQQP